MHPLARGSGMTALRLASIRVPELVSYVMLIFGHRGDGVGTGFQLQATRPDISRSKLDLANSFMGST
jgi:hypothetical protein